jgi:hypothetical protein
MKVGEVAWSGARTDPGQQIDDSRSRPELKDNRTGMRPDHTLAVIISA